ncbi:hypothetical protein M0804_009325 [Polistes exclamans]|nr:hypothetical protein M0804_009325 [Polistes exclamans]
MVGGGGVRSSIRIQRMRCLRFFNAGERRALSGRIARGASFKKVFARVDLKTKRKTSSKPRELQPPVPPPPPPQPSSSSTIHPFSLIYYVILGSLRQSAFLYLN